MTVFSTGLHSDQSEKSGDETVPQSKRKDSSEEVGDPFVSGAIENKLRRMKRRIPKVLKFLFCTFNLFCLFIITILSMIQSSK